jgi:hypothetical protein
VSRWALALLVVSWPVAAQWTPQPTATPRPRPTATPTPRPVATPTATPRPVATPSPSPTPGCPTCPPAPLREFVFIPGIPLNAPQPGQPLTFPDGTEFIVLVKFSYAGEVPFRLVRVR